MVKQTPEQLFKLYELLVREEYFFIQLRQSRVAYYSGILVTLVSATVTGLLLAEKPYQFLLLGVGPIMIFVVALIAIFGTSRPHLRFLETITMRAKVEQDLGLTDATSRLSAERGESWSGEPIVPARYVESREKYKTSDDFIKGERMQGYWKAIVYLFCSFIVIAVVLCLTILTVAVWVFVT